MSDFEGQIVTVLGGAGYIGCVLTRHLLDAGVRVRVFDNFTFGSEGIERLKHPSLEILEGDICDIRRTSAAIAGSDAIVLLAAVVGKRVADDPRPFIREVNLLASSVVIDAAIEHGASRLIFASSDAVYGMQSGVMYETGTPDPVSLYSRLKLRMEEQVIRSKKRTFHPTALRIANCYGYSPRMRFDLVANALIRDAVLKKEITITAKEQVRALVHVDDVARAIVSCLRAHVSLVSGQIFNVGSNEQTYQLNHLVNLVKTLVPEVSVNILGGSPDVVDYHLSSSKIQKLLDFRPQGTVERAMIELKELLSTGRFSDPFDPRLSNT
ncbi:MAG: SDR family oxidoreductase [Deltaproteobacteria bacterium]|nr:SDR family oxidoreductase [Deltaproteobacteria bacterium]